MTDEIVESGTVPVPQEETVAESETPVIDVRNLVKRYGNFTAVDNLSLSVKKGEFMGILGPNGAGKSTTLKAITGLLTPTSGEIFVNGIDARKHREAMCHVGCVIETPQCYPKFSPAEMLEYVGQIHGLSKSEIQIRSRDVLEELRMWPWRGKNIGGFSKGMKQRVALAAALLPNPDVILLDEPTSGLDPRGMIEIRQILNGLKQRGLTLMISTHILKEVSEMCTSVTMINHGKQVISGDVNSLIHSVARDEKSVTIDLRTIGSLTSDFYTNLGAMAGVSDVERTGERSCKFKFLGNDEQQADIVDLVYSHKLRLLCMNETGADLESLYMKLTDDGEVNVK
ncbi:ABC-type multidrug transport system, ATPase component [Thermoplasmatales archaeon BRNA1]|nr:ABC-type multidrug transport system, ATPase component [Thermoplasmatales archaeon BRNA1]